LTAENHPQLANFIWSICNLLRGPYKRNEYRKVILPLTVLRRFDCLLAPTKAQVLAEHPKIKAKPETVVRSTSAGYEEFGVKGPEETATEEIAALGGDEIGEPTEDTGPPPVPSPFDIIENVIYHPPHISPRLRAQDSVLLACQRPFEALEERDWLEILIRRDAHDDIRDRLDQYGVFDRQLFPDLDGIAKSLRFRMFENRGVL
jgi:hypothetical protein